MPTTTATGLGRSSDTATAIKEALDTATKTVTEPDLAFVFAGPDHDLPAALAAVRERAPGVDVLGCTTAGEFTEAGKVHGGISVMLVDHAGEHRVRYATGLAEDEEKATAMLAEGFSDAKKNARSAGLRHSTTVSLIDALSGTAEAVISGLRDHTGALQQIVGGAAGDEGRFEGTPVAANDKYGSNAAAVVHIFDAQPWGVGVDHGLTAATEQKQVTKAEGATIHEIDGQPAFQAYEAFAKSRGVELDPKNAGEFMIAHELGVFFFDEIKRARAPLAVNDDGSLSCAASVPEGSFVAILDGEPDSLVAAAKRAAEEAKGNLQGKEAAGVLVFDCICRGMILGDWFQEELDAVQEVFPDTPVAGFLTYGEIARFKGRLDGWHNTTAVVVAIPR